MQTLKCESSSHHQCLLPYFLKLPYISVTNKLQTSWSEGADTYCGTCQRVPSFITFGTNSYDFQKVSVLLI